MIATGDHARIEQRTLVVPREALQAAVSDEAIARLNNLPAPDSRVFEGRDDALAFLRELPSAGTGIVAQSVRGMGGVGKSTLVLHHAHACLAAGHGPVWWIDASSAASITAALASLAAALSPVHGALPLNEAAAWAIAWLQGRSGWLLIFDNAEEPTDLSPSLGRLTTGQVLITTRRDLPWHDLATPLRLDPLTPETSVTVLREITGRHSGSDTAALAELSNELGHLPLALQQAGAYLAQTRTSVDTYLTHLRADPGGILAATAPGDPHQRTIAQLWSVSLAAVHTVDPRAAGLLAILSHCAPDPLPRRVLATALPTPQAVDHALGVLAAYSMIDLTETTVTVHRLVQTVLRTTSRAPAAEPGPAGIRRLLRRTRTPAAAHPSETALGLLHAATPPDDPDDVETWPDWEVLLPHIQAASAYHDGTGGGSELACVHRHAVSYLLARGLAVPALPLAERALRITEAALGPDHPDTATDLNGLALTLGALGRHLDALPLKQRALRITETAFGPDHPDTALRLNNLALTLGELGRHTDALPLAERALHITETALGPDHPTTATDLGNLALRLTELARHAEALPLAERALRITEAALGPDHPDTATRLGNLATTLSGLQRDSDALPLEERALRITEAAFGPDHPDTALRLSNLALTLGELGRHTDALPLAERALHITETALGPDHPDVATDLGNVASTLCDLGRHADALPLAERALGITEAAFGPDHPDTALRLNNLAFTLGELGRHTDALPLAERALHITETALGPDHPTTARRRNNVAGLREDLRSEGPEGASPTAAP